MRVRGDTGEAQHLHQKSSAKRENGRIGSGGAKLVSVMVFVTQNKGGVRQTFET